jgi:hypothetical protein
MSDADTDNPAAANMVGTLVVQGGMLGRGYNFASNHSLALALPTNVPSLPRARGYYAHLEYVGVPVERILDVFSYGNSPEFLAAFPHLPRPCEEWIHPVFDRGHYDNHRTENRIAIRRRSLGRTPEGREILQRTRNSQRDVENAPASLLRSLMRPNQ